MQGSFFVKTQVSRIASQSRERKFPKEHRNSNARKTAMLLSDNRRTESPLPGYICVNLFIFSRYGSYYCDDNIFVSVSKKYAKFREFYLPNSIGHVVLCDIYLRFQEILVDGYLSDSDYSSGDVAYVVSYLVAEPLGFLSIRGGSVELHHCM